jgi:integrase
MHVDRLEADFGHWWQLPMRDVTPAKVDAWRKSERERGVSARTVNRNLSRLRSTLAKAVEWGFLETNPIASIKPLRFEKTLKVRYLTPDQEAHLFAALAKREQDMREARARHNEWRAERGIAALDPYPEPYADYLRPLVLVVRNTGLRRSEALSLRWADVDVVHKVITIKGIRSKTQQTRRVPLNSVALETIRVWYGQQAPAADNEFVFGQDPQDRQLRICTAWRGVRKAAGLGDLRFHDLRHHFASKLVQKGADLNTVRELLGHASIDMTLAYAHLAPDGLAAAVEQIV